MVEYGIVEAGVIVVNGSGSEVLGKSDGLCVRINNGPVCL